MHVRRENLSRDSFIFSKAPYALVGLSRHSQGKVKSCNRIDALNIFLAQMLYISAYVVGYLLMDCGNSASFDPLHYFTKKGKLCIFSSERLCYLIKPFISSSVIYTVIYVYLFIL